MKLHRSMLFIGVLLGLIIGTSCNVFGDGISGSERKIDICDSAYSIIYTDDEYYIMDFDGMCIAQNKADNIKEIFEYRYDTYLINVMMDGDNERWQLWKLNIDSYGVDSKKEDFELVLDDAYAVFKTFTVGIINIQDRDGTKFDISYKDEDGEERVIVLDMEGFEPYGGFRNLKQMDVRGDKVYLLTLAGELIKYDCKSKEFEKITENFVYSIRREIDY